MTMLCRIVAAREQAPITHTRHLVQAIGSTRIQGGKQQRKGSEGGSKGIHPATRTFQVGVCAGASVRPWVCIECGTAVAGASLRKQVGVAAQWCACATWFMISA
jgi:hypothetical protein